MKPSKYKEVFGWFDFENFYDFAVENLSDGAHIVEIGAFSGRSTIYLAEKIKEKGLKNVVVDAVDHWYGSENEPEQTTFIESIGGDLYAHFIENIKKAEVDDIIVPVRLPSVYSSTKYKNESLDFIFVDGDHFNGNCFQDICHWYPKLKPLCLIAGHDINCESVYNDVRDFFGAGKYSQNDNDVWFHIKPKGNE